MRENSYLKPPPKLDRGIPLPPPDILYGAEMLAVDDGRVASITNVEGKLYFHVVAASGSIERFQHAADRKPGEPVKLVSAGLEEKGVTFWLAPNSASELVVMMGQRPEGDRALLAAEPAALVDVGELSSFSPVLLRGDRPLGAPDDAPVEPVPWHGVREVDDKRRYPVANAYIFFRSWDMPYAVRLHLTEKHCDLFCSEITRALSTVTHTQSEQLIEILDVGMKVVKIDEKKKDMRGTPTPGSEGHAPKALPAAPAPAAQKKRGVLGKLSAFLFGE